MVITDLLEIVKHLPDDKNLEDVFVERTKQHIDKVQAFGQKLGYNFKGHDFQKLGVLLSGYKYFCKRKEDRTEDEEKALDVATYLHIISCSHHPEFWTTTDLTGFTRQNPIPNGVLDVSGMDEISIIEMVCDWKAVGEEKGNTVLCWLNKVNGTRWNFTKRQIKLIRDIAIQLSDKIEAVKDTQYVALAAELGFDPYKETVEEFEEWYFMNHQ